MNEQEQPRLKRSNALLAGHYHVIGMVGKGSFGAVYKAEDVQRNGLFVAIKEINLSGLSPQEVIEATDTFNREVRLLFDLKHPNLPHIYDHFTDAEHWYLVMDFIEGETLEEYLDSVQRKNLPVAEVLDIGIQLSTVLHYLHTRQPPIIFRDVKPANIMRTPTGHLYLIDFGIARHFTPGQARDTSALGSPGYTAPEQYGKAQTTVQSDIYSLGATLQTLLTGKDPLEPTFGYASPYAEGVLAELELLLVQMLDPDASRRPASMDAVKRTLQRIKDESLPKVSATQQLAHSSGYAIPTVQQMVAPADRRLISQWWVIVECFVLVVLLGGLHMLIVLVWQVMSVLDAVRRRIAEWVFSVYTYRGHSNAVQAVAWSPDGSRIASGSADKTVQVWDAANGGHVFTYRGHACGVTAVAWSPDGKHIASRSWDYTVQVWDAVDGGHVYIYRGHSFVVTAVAWSPDGRRIASGSGNPRRAGDTTVQVWDATDGSHVYTYWGHACGVTAVAWSPDGKHIASGSGRYFSNADNTVQVWDAVDGGHVYIYRGHADIVSAVAWSPDGKRIASGSNDHTVQVWDAADGGNAFTYRGHSDYVYDYVYAVAWSPDGKRIASASGDATVQVWDAADGGHIYTYRGHSKHVYAVAWSPDGKRIASVSWDKTVQVWKAP